MDQLKQIQIYQSDDGQVILDVMLDKETIWLTQEQISGLFQRERSVITKHINNVFTEEELSEKSNVQKMHIPNSDKPAKFYSLDVIISIGYRVKSKRGTQFRIWANQVLKDHLVKGFSINEKLLKEKEDKLKGLVYSVGMIEKISKENLIGEEETQSLLSVISRYVKAIDILDRYDNQTLDKSVSSTPDRYRLTFEDAQKVITQLKQKFGGSALFARKKDNSFRSSISTIYQTFEGTELYPGVQQKAANLLYFLVKNHSFADGNKRIAVAIFLWYMHKNGLLFNLAGEKLLDDNTLVGITLLIAESNPKEKEQIINVLINLIN